MTANRSALAPTKLAAPSGGMMRSWTQFWFTPIDPIGLHALRLLTGLLVLAWLLPLAGHLDELFGPNGWYDSRAIADTARLPDPPPPSAWSLLYLGSAHAWVVPAVYWGTVAVAALFALGLLPRLTAVLTWVGVVSFTANPVIFDDADVLLLLLTFYLMVGYLLTGQRAAGESLAARLFGPMPAWLFGRSKDAGDEGRPSLGANLATRLLQVHFAIVLVVSGLHKLQVGDWWAGVALWYPLYPPLETTVAQARAYAEHYEFFYGVLSLAAYAVLAWQIGFPLFAGRPRLRVLLLGGAFIGLLGSAFLYRQPLFGGALFVGCLSYLTPAEWRRAVSRAARVPGLNRLTDLLPAAGAENGEPGWAAAGAETLVAGRNR